MFKTRPKSVEADLDQVAVLTCDVDGNPPADIVWIHEPTDRVSENAIFVFRFGFCSDIHFFFVSGKGIVI